MYQRGILLFLGCLMSGALWAQRLDVEAFEARWKQDKQAILLDVRTSGEFGGGHLPKAMNLDFRSPNFLEEAKKLDKSKPILIYCLSGGRSAQAAELLRKEGYQVAEMMGGYLKWTTKMKAIEGVPQVAHDPAWDLNAFKKASQVGPVVVDFYAKWCAPCLKMMPSVDRFAKEYEGKVQVLKVEADGNQAVMQAFGIDEIPSFLVFQQGKLIEKTTGFREDPALKELFERALNGK